MNEQKFESFAENTLTALSNMNEALKVVQYESVVVAGDKLATLIDNFNKYKNSVDSKLKNQDSLNIALLESSKKVEKMESKLDTLEFDDEGRLQELKKTYQKRIFFLCGNDKSNPEYILFSGSLLAQINIYLRENLHVNLVKNIRTSDFQGAMVLARNYKPDKFKMNRRFKDLFKKYEKETLTKEQKKAMEELLTRMGGTFDMDKLFGGRCV